MTRFGSSWVSTRRVMVGYGVAALTLDYLQRGATLPDSPGQMFRLICLAVVACYVVWLTAKERGRSESRALAQSAPADGRGMSRG